MMDEGIRGNKYDLGCRVVKENLAAVLALNDLSSLLQSRLLVNTAVVS